MILFKEKYADRVSDTTLLAIRVLVASCIGLAICYLIFTLGGDDDFRDRIYWVVLAVVSVAVSTSSSVVYTRAKAIIIFSLLGTSIGSVILFNIQKYVSHDFTLIASLCCIGLAFYVYTLFLNYATCVFFFHIYLVMYFGLFIGWDKELFFVRVTCVAVGTLSIVLITFLTRGRKNRVFFNRDMYRMYSELKSLINHVHESIDNRRIMMLLEKSIKLNEALVNAKYEFSSTKKYYEYKKILILIDELLINLRTYRTLFMQQKKHDDSLYKEFVHFTKEQIQSNFKKITIRYDRLLAQK